jgi:hypothetical protein
MSNRNTRLIRHLESLRLPELWAQYRAMVGEDTRCPNRTYLIRRIREAAEAQALDAPATPAPARTTPTRAATRRPTEPATPQATAAPPEPPAPATAAVDEPTPEPEAGVPDASPLALTEATVGHAAPQPAPPRAPQRAAPAPTPRRAHDATSAARRARERPERGRFTSMTVEELRTLYLSVVGRPTGSSDKRYLIWKVREAEKGRVPVGPRETRTPSQEAVTDMRILPLRLDAPRVAALDSTWRAKGMKSRMDLFRRALAHYLAHVGAHGAAALFEAS